MGRGQTEAFPERYEDEVKLGPEVTLGSLNRLLDAARGFGTADFHLGGSKLSFKLEAEDDWDLRDALSDLEVAFSMENVPYTVDKAKIVRKHDGN